MEKQGLTIDQVQVNAMTLIQELGNVVTMLFGNVRQLSEQNSALAKEIEELKAAKEQQKEAEKAA